MKLWRRIAMTWASFVEELRQLWSGDDGSCIGCGAPLPRDPLGAGWRFVKCADGVARWRCAPCRRTEGS